MFIQIIHPVLVHICIYTIIKLFLSYRIDTNTIFVCDSGQYRTEHNLSQDSSLRFTCQCNTNVNKRTIYSEICFYIILMISCVVIFAILISDRHICDCFACVCAESGAAVHFRIWWDSAALSACLNNALNWSEQSTATHNAACQLRHDIMCDKCQKIQIHG